jgi:hypothetical protein
MVLSFDIDQHVLLDMVDANTLGGFIFPVE